MREFSGDGQSPIRLLHDGYQTTEEHLGRLKSTMVRAYEEVVRAEAERVGVGLNGVSLVAPVEMSRPAWLLDDGDREEAG